MARKNNDSWKNYRRTRNLYDPKSKRPYRLSRSRIENFVNCPRCFYMDRRLGVEPPRMPPFTLNSAVDELLKREFDGYRKRNAPHPIMEKYGIKAVPFAHPLLDEWRENFKGVRFHHQETNLIIFGAVDDLWVKDSGEIIVVDYKATSTTGTISIDTESRMAYKRQMDIYQWLLRKQDLQVANTAIFVYCNADRTKNFFDSKLDFSLEIIPYEGNDQWVEETIYLAYKCLQDNDLPDYTEGCEYCQYRRSTALLEQKGGQDGAQMELFPKS